MEIEKKDDGMILLSSLTSGNCFISGEDYFIKGSSVKARISCTNLSTGDYEHLHPDLKIQPIHGKLVWKYIK